MRPWPILSAALLLTGCAARMTEIRSQWEAADDKTCLISGIERDSDTYVACRMKLAKQYRPFRVNSNLQ
jgi:hypothetical protein